ncbi:MAG: hypothetical protein U9N36_03150 [Euryarchaeota archaeon]|nr:hypothetical protein [Euryarchaeota archaeon]
MIDPISLVMVPHLGRVRRLFIVENEIAEGAGMVKTDQLSTLSYQ